MHGYLLHDKIKINKFGVIFLLLGLLSSGLGQSAIVEDCPTGIEFINSISNKDKSVFQKSDVIVNTDANISDLQLQYSGADNIKINTKG